MLSSNQNIENISQLILEIKNYIELKSKSLQIDFVSKLTQLLTALLVGFILFMLITVAILFISMMVATALSPYVGGDAAGYAIVVAFYALFALLIYKKRHTWVEAPIANFLGHLFLDKTSAETNEDDEE